METSSPEEDKKLADRYRRHLVAVKKYQQANADKMRIKLKEWNDRIKTEKPDLYQARLERKRSYYQDVVRPRNEAKRQATQAPSETA